MLTLTPPRVAARLVALFLCITPVAARAQGCTAPGFLLVVETPGVSLPDSVYAQSMAHALAYRWPVPSMRRESYTQWRRTPVGRFRRRALAPSRVSGDEVFDRSLRLMVSEPLPASPDLPPFPASVTADSLIVRVHLGAGADSVAGGRIRFASGQRPVALVPGSLEFNAPRGPNTPPASQRFATVKYDVNEQGRVLLSTVEVLDSSDRDLADAVRAALARARFRAAEQDCRPVTISVVQTFRG